MKLHTRNSSMLFFSNYNLRILFSSSSSSSSSRSSNQLPCGLVQWVTKSFDGVSTARSLSSKSSPNGDTRRCDVGKSWHSAEVSSFGEGESLLKKHQVGEMGKMWEKGVGGDDVGYGGWVGLGWFRGGLIIRKQLKIFDLSFSRQSK